MSEPYIKMPVVEWSWQSWFAWRPVKMLNGRWAWLRYVERRKVWFVNTALCRNGNKPSSAMTALRTTRARTPQAVRKTAEWNHVLSAQSLYRYGSQPRNRLASTSILRPESRSRHGGARLGSVAQQGHRYAAWGRYV